MHIKFAILVLVLMLAIAISAVACYQPPITMATYRSKPTCYGFVRQIIRIWGKDNMWQLPHR